MQGVLEVGRRLTSRKGTAQWSLRRAAPPPSADERRIIDDSGLQAHGRRCDVADEHDGMTLGW
jgi:hypothetical protein